MNAMLNITIRMNARDAMAQATALRGAINGIGTTAGSVGAGGMTTMNKALGLSNLEKFGKNLQWTGRQLEYNFTLPLVLAGGAATKFALDNEAAFTQVVKAYGAFEGQTANTKAELDALRTSFELLSDRFGIHQKDVLTIASDWAQAGASGVALAKAVRLTMETMVLGQESAAQATESLLTIQGAYRLNTDQLKDALVTLNAVQVTTAIEFSGLVDAVARAGGAAATAGIDIQHLAAMAAALVPATGSAAAAGNALRTMISRIMAPTQQAADEMAMFGINVTDASWQAMDGVQRIQTLAQSYANLSDGQQALASSAIASRWQINRFDVLMRDLVDTNGVYATALDNTNDKQRSAALYAQQLSTVLSSSPQAFKILTTNIQNALAKAILPLLPALQMLLTYVLKLMNGFSSLSPQTQGLIIGMLGVLALIGPVVRYLGSFTLLFTTLGKGFHFVITRLIGYSIAQAEATVTTDAATTSMVRQQGVIGKLFGLFATIIKAPFKMAAAIWSWAADAVLANGTVAGAFAETAAAENAAMAEEIAMQEIVAGWWTQAAAQIVAAEEAKAAAAEQAAAAEVLAMRTAVALNAEAAMQYIEAETLAATEAQVLANETAAVQAAAAAEEMARTQAQAAADAEAAAARYAIWADYYAAVDGLILTNEGFALQEQLAIGTGSATLTAFLVDSAGEVAVGQTAAASTTLAVWSATWAELTALGGEQLAIETARANVRMALEDAIASNAALSGASRFAIEAGSVIETTAVEVTAYEAGATAALEAGALKIASYEAVGVAAGEMAAEAVAAEATAAAPAVIAAGAAAGISGSMVALVAAIAAAVVVGAALIWKFKDAIWDAITAIGRGIWALPGVFVSALSALINVIAQAVQKAVEWLSYLNPFQRHSPSLVDNVTAGVSTILDQYARLNGVGATIRKAAQAFVDFKNATQGGSDTLQNAQYADQKSEILKVSPDAGPAIDAMIESLHEMYNAAELVNQQFKDQQSLVDDMQRQIDQDMKPYNDAIYANEEAQKKLRLEILKMKQAGQSIDDMKNKMSALAGEIEMLAGKREELRLAGAGSDILGTYDDQIKSLQDQQVALEGQVDPIQKLQDELQALQDQAEQLNLEKDLTFDPQLKALDEQKDRLDQLKDAYSDITNQIRDMEQALTSMSSAASSAAAAAGSDPSLASAQFDAAAGANFPDVTGDTIPGLGREGGLPDIQDFNKQLQDELDNALANMGNFDMFAPIKDAWDNVWGWVKDHVGPLIKPVLHAIVVMFTGLPGLIIDVLGLDGIAEIFWHLYDNIVGGVQFVAGIFQSVWNDIIYPALEAIVNFVVSVVTPVWDALAAAVDWAWNTVISPAIEFAWGIIEPVFNAIVGFITGYLVPIWELMGTVMLIPIFALAKLMQWLWDEVLSRIFNFIVDHITDFLVPTWQLLATIVIGVAQVIANIVLWLWQNGIQPIFNQISWIINNVVVPAFTWLWDHGVQPSINQIASLVSWAWNTVLSPIFGGIGWTLDHIVGPAFSGLLGVVQSVWGTITSVITGAWSNIEGVLENGINWMINVFNFLARGVNKIASFLGMGEPISYMDQVGGGGGGNSGNGTGHFFASGGIPVWDMGGPGGATNIPTAIVGEGKSSYPEYVIPTDPKYRDRALSLFASLGTKLLDAGDVLTGGALGNPFDTAKDVAGMVKEFWDDVNGAISALSNVTLGVMSAAGTWTLDAVKDWGVDKIKSIPGAGALVDAAGHLVDAGSSLFDLTPIGGLKSLFAAGGIPNLGAGGIVPPRTGGTLVNLAEKGQGEAVVYPLGGSSHGEKHYHFYGDLSFPNIKSGNDADVLIRNLESLVED